MAGRQRRLKLTNDDELARAIERARPYFPDLPAAALVRELALRGAMAIEAEEARRARWKDSVWAE